MTTEQPASIRPGSIFGGAILLALGVAILLDRDEALPIRTGQMVAPFVLIAIGAAFVFERGAFVCGRRSDGVRQVRQRGDSMSGLWLIGIGAWMLVSQLHLFGLTYATSWPLFIILSGVMIVLRGMTAPRVAAQDRRDD